MLDEDSHSRESPLTYGQYQSRNLGPIPAYTSNELAIKYRTNSENRYINQSMEYELASYKEEIERRF